MPFDIYVTRQNVIPFDDSGNNKPIGQDEFSKVMRGATIIKAIDSHTFWVGYPQTNEPLCAVRLVNGSIILSVSFSYRKFISALINTFHLALRISRELKCNVIEEYGSTIITKRNINKFLNVNGEFIQFHYKFWSEKLNENDAKAMAPLEFPHGPVDFVSEYFFFHLDNRNSISLSEMIQKENFNVHFNSPDTAMILDDNNQLQMVKILLDRTNNSRIQIWPYYYSYPFATVAQRTISIAGILSMNLGSSIQFNMRDYSGEIKGLIEENSKGLGIDFYLWLIDYLNKSDTTSGNAE